MNSLVKKLTNQTLSTQEKRGYDYTVLCKTDDYEKRLYTESSWVCTSVTSVYQDTAKIEAFRKLQSYVMGHNEAGAQLSMQAPILTRVFPHDGLSFERRFIVSALLSTDKYGREPQPTDPDVYIDHLPEMVVFARTFQGIACEEKWAFETRCLLQCLSNKEDIRTDTYITATYDSPFQLMASRNEVWMLEFDKKKDLVPIQKEQQFVQMGSKRLDVPTAVSWPLFIVLGTVYFVMGVIKNVFFALDFVKTNWSSLSDCRTNLSKYLRHLLSVQSVSNIALTTVSSVWKMTMGIIKNV